MEYIVQIENIHKVLVFKDTLPFLEHFYTAARKGNDLILVSASRNVMDFLERKYKNSKRN